MRWGDGRRALRRFAVRVLQAAPPKVALPIARRWWASRRLRTSALDLFEVHAQPEDIQRIIPVLGWRFTVGTHYLIDGALDALAEHPQYAPFPGLESLYHRAAMSCTRERVVKLMGLTEPGFSRGLAFECLWDAEESTRVVAAGAIDLDMNGARERLEAMAAETVGWEGAAEAAKARLAA